MTPKVYFISGLGADHRLFIKQIEAGIPLTVIPWKIPYLNESLTSYVNRMAEEIPVSKEPVILGGVSFGGIIAVELSKVVKAEKIILVSSIKTSEELPVHIRLWKYFPMYKLLPGTLFKKAGYWARMVFGTMNKEESAIFSRMVSDANPVFIKWAIHQVVNWENKVYPSNTVHIHGTRDLIFPFLKLKPPVIPVQKGTHIMIITSADEVNMILKKECKDSL